MYDFIKRLKIVPVWMIMTIDLILVFLSSLLALFVRENLKIPTNFEPAAFLYISLIFVVIHFIFFQIFKTANMVIRFTNSRDVLRIFYACVASSSAVLIANFISYYFSKVYLVPTSVLIIEFFITIATMILYRFAFKVFYFDVINPTKNKKNIVIYGAGETGISAKRALDRDSESKYNVLAFFDEDGNKTGKNIENLPVISFSRLNSYLDSHDVSFLIIAVSKLSTSTINKITEIAINHKVKILKVPPVNRWINGALSFKQIKKIKIEDLLERDPIVLEKSLINKDLKGKTIMITGAAGSIGSEIVRQILKFNYQQLILVDNAETPMFYLHNYCYDFNKMQNIELQITNILDEDKMEELISKFKPSIIYHAAAYKHVPMMEFNVNAAIKTNILGTKILADIAVKYNVEKFVMISTDKAVNPSTVMGTSKRVAEMYVQSLNFAQDHTKFITTRFGNVLGSNGSVIPIFNQQIAEGGPVKVTHPEVTRYFMTIPEACQLVINAGAMGKGGEIFIFDMGESVKIYDLAVKMIKLSGLELGKDISIEFTGLRPGEKLYEELLADEENTLKTPNNKIMIAKVRPNSFEAVERQVNEILAMKNAEPEDIVRKLKTIVPEFDPKNSDFQ